ncbi:MAG: hypothetical protein COB23_00260 [Methylophaga sp.]|nr:MAG: hypothetical protein COB23_00260 [Methylophaga sp.]
MSKVNQQNISLIAYSEAFVSVIPYFILMAISTLFAEIFKLGDISLGLLNIESLQYAEEALAASFSYILLIAISFQLAKRYKINHLILIFLSMATFVSVEALFHVSQGSHVILSSDSSILALTIPLIVNKLLLFFTSNKQRYLDIGGELNSSIQYVYIGVVIFTISTGLFLFVETSFAALFSGVNIGILISSDLMLLVRSAVVHILWFFGLHGTHLVNSIFDMGFMNLMIFNGLSYAQFYELFVIYGGAGSGLSLILAIFIAGKDQHSNRIAKLATPFAIFNINEILIFGLPIIFNRRLFIPFICVPLVNTAIAYIVLTFYPVEIVNTDVPWITPIFIDSYLATGGDFFVLGLQFFSLLVGIAIYIPFVKKYTASQSVTWQQEMLSKKLDIRFHLQSEQDLEAHKAKSSIIETNQEIEKIINLINSDNLRVYYQPKVDMKNKCCNQYEALLRINMSDGLIRGPFFLPAIETAGLAPIIDLWVCQQVKEHILWWKKAGVEPEISINLHRDTLGNNEVLQQIIDILLGLNVDIEIIERELLESKGAIKNITRLKESGFSISIDDFGTGYSSFEMLCSIPIDSVKLDKSLIDLIHTPKGYAVCKHITNLCRDLGFICVAEGVEEKEQIEIIKKLKISYVQGYYYSPAFSYEKVLTYQPSFD